MQKIFEPIVHIIYLTFIFLMSNYMFRNSVGNKFYKIYGTLALLLGVGDGAYIIPRMYSVLTTGIEDNLKIIGLGRMANSIIITIFFLVLYDAYNERYSKKNRIGLNRIFYILGIIRVIVSLLPWNNWFEINPSSTFALLRFIPLFIMGLLLILLMYLHSKRYKDSNFKIITIATLLSIIFMEPRIFSQESSIVLIFTILRTISLSSIIIIGFRELRDKNVLSRY